MKRLQIGYLVHNLNDPAVERRCVMLDRGGAEVRLAGFCRDENVSPAVQSRSPLVLGESQDAAMVKRAASTLKWALLNGRLKALFADCDVIIARNLEQLAIARSVVGVRPLIYECLDIHRSLVGGGAASKAVQFVEAKLLPRVNLLLTSSPAFMREHFNHRPLAAPTILVENKLLVSDGGIPDPVPATPAEPLAIGWFGMLRCRKTFEFLAELAGCADGRIEVLICGKPSPAELPDLAAEAARTPGMRFTGPYSYSDLPELYGQCHFAWTIDWFEEGLNSSWLLPNRLYEAISHGSIPIALANIELGRWLSAHNAGLCVENPQAAMEQLLGMTTDHVAELQQQVMAVERQDVVAATRDCVELVEAIGQIAAT